MVSSSDTFKKSETHQELSDEKLDQYKDGKAGYVWNKYKMTERTDFFRENLLKILRKYKCHTIFDIACGDGVDSVNLLEEGFDVVSCDLSEDMLDYARKTRKERCDEAKFANWEIAKGNWLTLRETNVRMPEKGFDALICMGNSFPHLPDFHGNRKEQIQALQQMQELVRPGGILLLDHRNFDHIVNGGAPPMQKNKYYKTSCNLHSKTSFVKVGKCEMLALDYVIYTDDMPEGDPESKFRLMCYPHLVDNLTKMIDSVFGESSKQIVLGDFMELDDSNTNPGYYQHLCVKS